MNITDIKNKKVVLSKGSITVKDDNDKTCGVVRNLKKWHDIPANKQFILRKHLNGIWGIKRFNIDLSKVYFDIDNNAYIIRNMKTEKHLMDNEKIECAKMWEQINNINIIEVENIL